jgi:hypothetical protein
MMSAIGIHINAVRNSTIEPITFSVIMIGLMMRRYPIRYSTDTIKYR